MTNLINDVINRGKMKKILIFFAIYILCLPIFGKYTEKPLFSHLGVNDGLPHNTIVDFVQDNQGVIWIATKGGLAKFDSYDVKTYHHYSKNPQSLGSDFINSLYKDSQGRLWVCTDKGLSLYHFGADHFKNFIYQHHAIYSVVELDPVHLLVNAGHELVVFNTTDLKFRKLGIAKLPIKGVSTLFKYADEIMIGCNEGIYRYNLLTKKMSRLHIPAVDGNQIQCLYRTADTHLYIGTEGSGLFVYHLVTHQVKHYTSLNSQLSSDYIRALSVNEDGDLWVGTVLGLNVLKKNGVLTHLDCDDKYLGKGTQPSIRCIKNDSQGGIWLGTYYNGVCYYNPRKNYFVNMQKIPGVNSLNNNIIGCIVEDKEHHLWIGTNGGLQRYNPITEHYELFTTANGLRSNDIKALYVDPVRHLLYIGSQLGGLSIMNIATKQIQTLLLPTSNMDDNSIYAIHPLEGGNKLLIGSLHGLKLYDTTTGIFRSLPKEMNGDCNFPLHIRAIFQDASGLIWLGGEDGLAAYRLQQGKLQKQKKPEIDSELASACVFSIYQDYSKNIWIASQQGLYQISAKTGKTWGYGMADGLPSNVIFSITQDSMGKFWIGTGHGLCSFLTKTHHFKNYRLKDGIQGYQFMPNAICKASNGYILFGGINGITSFKPESFTDNPFAPPVLITELKLFDKIVKPGDETGLLTSQISQTQRIVLRHDQSMISLKLAVANFVSGSHNTFAYKLEGYDNKWHHLTDDQNVIYSYLPPGTYRFLVKAANNDDKWNEKPTMLEIKVLSPWYATWFAKFIYFLAFAGLLYAIFRFFQDREREKQIRIQEHNEQIRKQEMYEMRQRFFIDISHELRTPLTLISSPLEEVMMRPEDSWTKSRLHLIQKNVNRLIHLVNQLMDYRRAELGVFKLKVRPLDLEAIIKKIYSLFVDSAAKRNIDYQYHCDLEDKTVLCDPNYLELMLTNLLSNAFKYTPDGKSIMVSAKVENGFLQLCVADTGKGIPDEQKNKIFERFYQIKGQQTGGWGIGLSIITRLVQLYHGQLSVESQVGEGSTFTITLPIRPDAFTQEEIATEEEIKARDIDSFYGSHTLEELKDMEASQKEVSAASDNTSSNASSVREEAVAGNTLGETEDETSEATGDEASVDKVLVVEDNREIRHYLSQSLSENYQVYEASNGKEALAILSENEVNLILTDVMMPEMDGIQLCNAVKSHLQTSHVPVIILSAKVDVEEQLAGLKMGADDYIPKPFSLAIVKAKIFNILRTHKQMIERYRHSKKIEPPKITVNSLDEEWMENALAVVKKHLSDDKFSTDIFAREMLMSRTSLYTKMKALTGESVKEFIRRIRLNTAAEMILRNEHSIAEISFLVGFATPSYFTTSFKKYFGCLPTEYIKKQAEGETEDEERAEN